MDPTAALVSLPPDLIRFIASFVPVHPRLVVLGSVCRRLRCVILASFPDFLPRACAVATLSAGVLKQDLARLAPDDMQSLHLPHAHNDLCDHLTHLTALTSLSVETTNPGAHYNIRRNIASLTSLSVTPGHAALPDRRLPHLAYLTLRTKQQPTAGDWFNHLASFIELHSAQLISLTLDLPHGSTFVVPPLALCRNLSLRGLDQASLLKLTASALPSLVSLKLYGCGRDWMVPASTELHSLLMDTVTDMEVVSCSPRSAVNMEYTLSTLLNRMSKLRSLAFNAHSAWPCFLLESVAKRCTFLHVYIDEPLAGIGSVSLHITSLTLRRYGWAVALLRTYQRFPRLAHLAISEIVPIRYFIREFRLDLVPRLCSLSMHFYRTRGAQQLFEAFLRKLEGAGVQQLEVCLTGKRHRLLKCMQPLWLHVTHRVSNST